MEMSQDVWIDNVFCLTYFYLYFFFREPFLMSGVFSMFHHVSFALQACTVAEMACQVHQEIVMLDTIVF